MKLFIKQTMSIILISGLLTACSPKTIEEYQTQTDAFLANDEKQSAIITLKDAIQKYPDEASLRFQLGSVYLSRGELLPALKELGLAEKWAYNPEEVLKLKVRAKFLEKDFEEVVRLADTEIALESDAWAYIYSYQAISYLELQEKPKALMALENALQSNPGSIYVKLAQSYLLVFENKEKEALDVIAQVLQENPDLPEAVLIEGVLLSNSGNTSEAVIRFEKYSKLLPGIIQAKLILANAYVDNGQYKEAESILDQLLKISENQPLVNQLKAIVRFNDDDFSNAKIYAERSMQFGLDNYTSRVIAGMSAMELDVYEQAYSHLSTIEKQLDVNSPARKALTFAQIKLGYTLDVSNIDYSENPTLEDFDLASMAALKLAKEDKLQEARSIFAQVSDVELTSAQGLAKKGLIGLSLEEESQGIESLLKALELDPLLEEARIGLASHYMESNDYDKAIEIAEEWLKLDPESVQAYGILALIGLSQKDYDSAEISYTKMAEIDPSKAGPKLFFAEKFKLNGQFEKAAALYEQVLDLNPTHLQTLINYSIVSAKLGKINNVVDRAAAAYKNDKTSLDVKGFYAMTLSKVGDYNQILSIWENTSANEGTPLAYWSSMGDALLGLGEIEKARKHYIKWLEVSPDSRLPYIRSALFYEVIKDFKAALNVIDKGLVISPIDEQFLLIKASLLLSDKQPSLVEEVLGKLPDSYNGTTVVKSLNGQLLLQQDDPNNALPLLEEVYSKEDSMTNLGFLVSAFTKAGKSDEATDLLESRVKKHPKEILPKLLLADFYGSINIEKALLLYQEVISLDANNVMALNNAAWINHKNNNDEIAERLAERAYKLSPLYIPIHDTYGAILLKNGKIKDGLKVLERAFKLRPVPSVAINYAKALIANGRRGEAVKVLNKISTSNPKLIIEIEDLKKNQLQDLPN